MICGETVVDLVHLMKSADEQFCMLQVGVRKYARASRINFEWVMVEGFVASSEMTS